MEKRFTFTGTGGALFVKFLVGGILTTITFGIYYSWFATNIIKYFSENTSISGPQKGDLRLEYRGTGGQLFVTLLVGGLLTSITFGIYYSWFMVKLMNFFYENTVAKAGDGTEYRLQFNGTGGSLFVTLLVGGLLTFITFGIYGAWFTCKLQKFMCNNTAILENGTHIGTMDFVGAGGSLFVTLLVGGLLTGITFGIYAAWYGVKLIKFFAENTEITVAGQRHLGAFTGTGGQLFITVLVGALLTGITFGIYAAWYACTLFQWEAENLLFAPR